MKLKNALLYAQTVTENYMIIFYLFNIMSFSILYF